MCSSPLSFTQKSRLVLTMRARSLVRHRVGRGVFLRTAFVLCPLLLAPPLSFLLAPPLRATSNLNWFAPSQMTTSISTLACHLILLGRIKTLSRNWIASACILPVVLAAFVIGAGASPLPRSLIVHRVREKLRTEGLIALSFGVFVVTTQALAVYNPDQQWLVSLLLRSSPLSLKPDAVLSVAVVHLGRSSSRSRHPHRRSHRCLPANGQDDHPPRPIAHQAVHAHVCLNWGGFVRNVGRHSCTARCQAERPRRCVPLPPSCLRVTELETDKQGALRPSFFLKELSSQWSSVESTPSRSSSTSLSDSKTESS